MSAFNALKQQLISVEKCIVVDFCLESADQRFPLTVNNLYECADNIVTNCKHTGASHWIPRRVRL